MDKSFKWLCLSIFLLFSITFFSLEYWPDTNTIATLEKDYTNAGRAAEIKGTKGYVLYERGERVAVRYQNNNGDWKRCIFFKWELTK